MQWGSLVEQAIGHSLLQLALLVFAAGIIIGIAVTFLMRRR